MKRSMAALVIGNASYPDGQDLANPANDANDLGAKLKTYGFNVIVATNCSAKELEKRLKEFRALLETHDVGLFFFAGHGMQIEGTNYLLATDTDMESETDAKHSSLSLDKVVDIMGKSQAATKIIILDACRNNPWERKWERAPGVRGLASVYAPKGTIIGFATSPGEVASDGVGRNGAYTGALLQHIETPDCSIESMFKRVRNTVAASTAGKQTSWEHTSLSGEFYFNLSLGNLIDEYYGTALADHLFTLDESKKSHQVIAGLKTHDWYQQNPVIDLLQPAAVNKMAKNSLFVVGRNIYQAACGSANAAHVFINEFKKRTARIDHEKRKALLDGMLFEVFFDSKGNLRKRIKNAMFNEVFSLRQFKELADSFEFIAEALNAAGGDFYVLPGKGHELAVTVSAKKKEDAHYVDAIWIDGNNVLGFESNPWGNNDVMYSASGVERFKKMLSEQLVVPARDLKLTFIPADAGSDNELRLPLGWSVRKASEAAE